MKKPSLDAMTAKALLAGLLRKTPRPDAISTLATAREFNAVYADAAKKANNARLTETQALSIYTNLSRFY